MKQIFALAILALLATPVHADFALGAEVFALTRDLEIGSLAVESDDSQALAVFVGFDVGNSMIYLKHSREETDFDAGTVWTYERSETAIDWNWNETTAKQNYLNLSVGLSLIDYRPAPGLAADFWGFSVGGGLTRFLGRNFFVNTRARLLLVGAAEEDLFASGDPEKTAFIGFEAQAAFGFQFGRKSSWSLQLGYKVHAVDFDGRFIDDEFEHGFLTLRFFIPSGK